MAITTVDLHPRIDRDEVCEAKLSEADRHHSRSTKHPPDAQPGANLNFNFPQVVQQHTLGEMGYIIWLLFTIYL